MTEFMQLASSMGIILSEQQEQQFEKYLVLLMDWNERINLTAIREAENIRVKHFLDSLSCLETINSLQVKRIVDVGTGAGFPGIPLKIARPNLELSLVESIQKKADFCKLVVQQLELRDVNILPYRVEELGGITSRHRGAYDLALARAVAEVRVLVEYLLPLVKLGGWLLLQKGQGVHAEVIAAESALQKLGGRIVKVSPIEVPHLADERYLVLIEKTQQTPEKFPRRVGIPSKRPL